MGGSVEVHHAVPRYLLRLHEAATEPGLDGRHIQAWLEYEHEAIRWGVPVGIGRADLEALVEASEVAMGRQEHRLLHSSDRARWGSRGGRETFRRYGRSWMALLARRRWGRITAAELDAARRSPR